MARATASVRLWALSLPMMEFTWNLTVYSLTSRREATPSLGSPSARSRRALFLRGVRGLGLRSQKQTRHELWPREGSVACSPWLRAVSQRPGLRKLRCDSRKLEPLPTGLGRLVAGSPPMLAEVGAVGQVSEVAGGGCRFPGNVPHDDIWAIDVQRQERVFASGHLPHHGPTRLTVQLRRQASPGKAIQGTDQNTELRHYRALLSIRFIRFITLAQVETSVQPL